MLLRHLLVEHEVGIVVAVIPEDVRTVLLEPIGMGNHLNLLGLGSQKAGALHPLGSTHGAVGRSPALVIRFDRDGGGRANLDVDHRTEDLHPEFHRGRGNGRFTGNLHAPFFELQCLPEGPAGGERIGGQLEPDSAHF